jgi:hypothetical protein
MLKAIAPAHIRLYPPPACLCAAHIFEFLNQVGLHALRSNSSASSWSIASVRLQGQRGKSGRLHTPAQALARRCSSALRCARARAELTVHPNFRTCSLYIFFHTLKTYLVLSCKILFLTVAKSCPRESDQVCSIGMFAETCVAA